MKKSQSPVGLQAELLVFETTDGQVFINRGHGEAEGEWLELTIHEWKQFREDVKAGHFDDLADHEEKLTQGRALADQMATEDGPITEVELAQLREIWPRPVGNCIGCLHDLAQGPCGGCGAV